MNIKEARETVAGSKNKFWQPIHHVASGYIKAIEDGPEVRALVEALEAIRDDVGCENGDEASLFARKTLSAFREAVGK